MLEFLRWWGAMLRACLPASLRAPAEPDAFVVTLEDPARADQSQGWPDPTRTAWARIAERQRGRLLAPRPLGAPRPAGTAVALRAWPGAVLRREVTLPLAVRDADLGRVLSYEMDRLTPFAAEEVAFGYRVLRRDRAAQTQAIALALVPRAALSPVLRALRDEGVAPDVLEDGPDRIALAPAAIRGRLAERTLAGACAVLAVAAIAVPFVRQARALAEAEGQIAALQPDLQQAEALRRKLAGGSQGSDVAAAEAAKVGNALSVLGTVTTLLPDDTYLNEFTLRQGRIGLAGQSASAPRLLSLLAADPSLRDPTFTAPVTRIEAPSINMLPFGGVQPPPEAGADKVPPLDLFAIRADLVL